MTADIRAAVLEGIKDAGMVAEINGVSSAALDDALRLLREDTERHVHTLYADPYLGSVRSCRVCGAPDGAGPDHWCPAIVSRAQVYAPDALKEKPDAD